MKSKIFIALLFVSLLLPRSSKACGYWEFEWEYRPMTFQVMLPSMYAMEPFMYTKSSLYYTLNPDPMNNDWKRNILEWQKATSPSVNLDDIHEIQYETSPTDFLSMLDEAGVKTHKNTFVRFLTSNAKNKELLDYMKFAKRVEASEIGYGDIRAEFEEWGSTSPLLSESNPDKVELLKEAKAKFKVVHSQFLKDRYAFQIVRLAWQLGDYDLSASTFKDHFGTVQKDNLMSAWAAMFCATSLDKKNQRAEANQLYAQAFDYSDSKKLRCMQMYNYNVETPAFFSNTEKSTEAVMKAVGHPGRALDRMTQIYSWDKNSKYMPFLVMREVNKLEDWLYSSLYFKTESETSICSEDNSGYNGVGYLSAADIKKKNLETDMQYLKSLKVFVSKLRGATKQQDVLDYYAIVLAHLNLLEENKVEAKKYLSAISSKASASIQVQKEIENIWMMIKTEDVTTPAFKKNYLASLKQLKDHLPQKSERDNFDPSYASYKVIYTLELALSNEYKRQGDVVTYCLLKNLSNKTKADSDEYYWSTAVPSSDYYGIMRQFDLNASVADMDKLIELIGKKNKTAFEKYLFDQKFNSLDAYKDLKGTIAFRNRDLKTAYATFKSMNQQFWNTTYDYKSYLNEDPFVVQGIDFSNRKFDYNFNKTQFVKTLIDLETVASGADKKKASDAYLKLGNASFNTTYWGNSWMMVSYGWSSGDYTDQLECLPTWKKTYYDNTLASDYYRKAYDKAINKEQKAIATLMLSRSYWNTSNRTKQSQSLSAKYAMEYFTKYKGKTRFDRQNKCLGYMAFVN